MNLEDIDIEAMATALGIRPERLRHLIEGPRRLTNKLRSIKKLEDIEQFFRAEGSNGHAQRMIYARMLELVRPRLRKAKIQEEARQIYFMTCFPPDWEKSEARSLVVKKMIALATNFEEADFASDFAGQGSDEAMAATKKALQFANTLELVAEVWRWGDFKLGQIMLRKMKRLARMELAKAASFAEAIRICELTAFGGGKEEALLVAARLACNLEEAKQVCEIAEENEDDGCNSPAFSIACKKWIQFADTKERLLEIYKEHTRAPAEEDGLALQKLASFFPKTKSG